MANDQRRVFYFFAILLGAFVAIAWVFIPAACGEFGTSLWPWLEHEGSLKSCSFAGDGEGQTLGAMVIPMGVGVICVSALVLIFMNFQWSGGPPAWSAHLGAFGLTIIGLLAMWTIGYFLLRAIAYSGSKTTVNSDGERVTEFASDFGSGIVFLVGTVICFIGPIIAAVNIGQYLHKVISQTQTNEHGCIPADNLSAFYAIGASVGVAAGVVMSLLVMATIVVMAVAYVTVIAFIWMWFALLGIGAYTMIRS